MLGRLGGTLALDYRHLGPSKLCLEAQVPLGSSLSYPLKRQLPLHCVSGKPSGEARPGVKRLLSSSFFSLLSNSLNKLL